MRLFDKFFISYFAALDFNVKLLLTHLTFCLLAILGEKNVRPNDKKKGIQEYLMGIRKKIIGTTSLYDFF